jgi:hypothetical protein
MRFQTIKKEETIQAEKIFREIVQNSVKGECYNLKLVDKDGKTELKQIPISFDLEEEYPIVILNKATNMTTWDIPRTLLELPNNEILYNKYHSLKRSIDFVFVGNGQIEWKRDKRIWVNNREGVNMFSMGCIIGFELVLTCDVDDNKYKDLEELNISPIYKVDTLELIKLYNQYKEQEALPSHIPVTKII